MLSRFAEICKPTKVGHMNIYGEEHSLYRLSFDSDESNIFVFRPHSKGSSEKIIDLDTGNALFPNNKGSCYMIYTADFRILAPYIYKIFIHDDRKILEYGSYVECTNYSTEGHSAWDFEIGGNTMSYGMGPTNLDKFFIKLNYQPKKLVLSNQGAWRLDDRNGA